MQHHELLRETIALNRLVNQHRMNRRRLVQAAAAGAAGVAGLAGPARSGVRAQEDLPTTMTVVWDQVQDNLDPQTSRGNRNWWVLSELYDTLTYLPGASLDPEPLLAESWEVSDDGTVYTFKLRTGIHFTTGAELNADAVKYSMDRLQTIGLGPIYMTRAFDSVEVIDPTTVAFNLLHPMPAWPTILSNPAVLGVIDPAFVEANGGIAEGELNEFVSTNTAGTGPYVISDWEPGQRIVLAANPDYWQGWDGDHVDEVILETVPEESTRLLRLERGDVDFATVTAASLPDLERRVEEQGLPIVIQRDRDGEPLLSLSTQWINMNNQMLPTSDINVRKALVHSFNYDLWIEQVLNGFALRMHGMIPRGILGHVDDYPAYPFDLDLAREFLDQASDEARAELESGLPLVFQNGYVLHTEGALMWQQDLASIGIDLQIEEVDGATHSGIVTSAPGVPLIEARWFPDYSDPDNFINFARTGYWPPAGFGASFAGDEQTDAWIEEGRAEQDPERRAEIYQQLELYFHEQAPLIMLAELSGVIHPWNGRAAWVQGFEQNPLIHPLYYHMWKESAE